MEQFIHQISGLFILDSDGRRVFCKYFIDRKRPTSAATHTGESKTHGKFSLLNTVEQQQKFEKLVFSKTHKQATMQMMGEADIAVIEGYNVVFAAEKDLLFYVFASEQTNEQVLAEVVHCILDALNQLFDGQMEKRTAMENFSHIVMTVDEVIDDGIIMETEAKTVAQRVEKVESSAQTITIAGEKVNLGEEGNAIASKLFKTAQGLFSF